MAATTVHCVRVSNDGLVYICDRWMNRIQVFDTMGNFQKNIPFAFKVWTPIPGGWNRIEEGSDAGGVLFFRRISPRSKPEVYVRYQ